MPSSSRFSKLRSCMTLAISIFSALHLLQLLLIFIGKITCAKRGPKNSCLPFAFQLLSAIQTENFETDCTTACVSRHETAAEWIGQGFLGQRASFQASVGPHQVFWLDPCLMRGILCLSSFAGYDTGASQYNQLLNGLQGLSCSEQFRTACPARFGLSGPTCICESSLTLERVSVFDVEYGRRYKYPCDPFEVCRRLSHFLGPVFVCSRFRTLSDEPISCFPRGGENLAQQCTCNRNGKQKCRILEWTTSNSEDFASISQQKLAEDGKLDMETLVIYNDYLRQYRPSDSSKAGISLERRIKDGLITIDLDAMVPASVSGDFSHEQEFTRLRPLPKSHDRALKRRRSSHQHIKATPMISTSPVADLGALNPHELDLGSNIASTSRSTPGENIPTGAIGGEQRLHAPNMVELAPVTSFVELLQQQISMAVSSGHDGANPADLHMLGVSGFQGNLAPLPNAWPPEFTSQAWLQNADQGASSSKHYDEGFSIDHNVNPFSDFGLFDASENIHLAPAAANQYVQHSNFAPNQVQVLDDQSASLGLQPVQASQGQPFETLSNLASATTAADEPAVNRPSSGTDRIAPDEDGPEWMQDFLEFYKFFP